MEEITLQALLEAGCHFGHKSERWHPKATAFIYTEKDGIHIIDLAKTKAGLEGACEFVKEVVARGDEVLFVATKRQARGVVKEEAIRVGAPYLVERWIGGFLTNWDAIRKNIEKINRLDHELETGVWKKFPKHEQSKLIRYLKRLKVFYGGVLNFTKLPGALFVIDKKKEDAAVREALRRGIPIVALVDTNADPTGIDYVIPGNDDAVGSVQYITHAIAIAYQEGIQAREKNEENLEQKTIKQADSKTVDKEVVSKPASLNKDEKGEKIKVKKKGKPKK